MGTCYLEGARDVPLSHHRCCRAFDFSTVSGFNLDGSTQQDAFIASWLQVTLLRAWASTSKRRSREVEGEFHQVCEFVWACLETATKAEGAAGETGRRRSRPRQSQFGIVRKMQYFLHVWDFVLVDFFGSSMTHGFYCVLSTVWGGADAESCTPGCRATRACQPRACGDTIFRKMITEMRGADLIFRIIYIRFLNQYKPQCKKFLRGTFFYHKSQRIDANTDATNNTTKTSLTTQCITYQHIPIHTNAHKHRHITHFQHRYRPTSFQVARGLHSYARAVASCMIRT